MESILHPVFPFLLCWSARALLLPGTCLSTLGAEGALSPSRELKSREAAGILGSLQGHCSAGIFCGSLTQHRAFCMNLIQGEGGLGFETGLENEAVSNSPAFFPAGRQEPPLAE